MSAPTANSSAIEFPRTQENKRDGTGRGSFEMLSWLFMRVSGVVLVVLVLGHLLIMTVLDGGVHRINWGFVAGRWSSPFWQVWDLLMLWLAQLHGMNGMNGLCTVINDYARKDSTRTCGVAVRHLAIFHHRRPSGR